MPRTIATNTAVDVNALLDFVRPRHRMILVTRRRDGSPQLSPLTGGVDGDGRIVVSTYPERAKVANLRRNPAASVPCGLTAAGLPVGLQIVGPMHADALVLRAARAFEAIRPWPMPAAPAGH